MITITLPSDIEAWLRDEASRHGLAPEEYLRKMIIEHLPADRRAQSLADLFAEWESEDATADPAEIARRNQEVEEFKEAMNRNRLEMEGPGSRKPFP